MKYISDRLGTEKRKKFGEILRFGIVGAIAALLQYGVYLAMLIITSPGVANTIGYIISFIFNFIASTHYTFKVKANAKRGIGFALSHVVNYLLQTLTLLLFIYIGVPKAYAPIPMFCICVPVNFILVRYFLTKKFH
ncbi:MAG: GtrA family protein [Prevotella sp.]|jgi:putative flippase GtrA|nr:GtrA family protein [Prevotella sp.]MBP7373511.1 GtrA family protein [Prevotella sp.]MBP8757083.1 GtrA family protein [Prevotella sp.]